MAPSQASMLLLLRRRPPSSSSSLLCTRRRLLSSASASRATAAISSTRHHRYSSSSGGSKPLAPLRPLHYRWLSTAAAAAAPSSDDGEFCLRRGSEALRDAFLRYGHYEAALDPLGLASTSPRPELDPARHFPPSALHQPLPPSALAAVGFVDEEGSSSSSSSLTPLELAARLRAVFCRAVGFEIAHIDDAGERAWLTQRIGQLFADHRSGGATAAALSPAERVNAAALMLQAEAFEHFLARKFPSFKRYSGEGAEAMQPAVDAILRSAHALGSGAVVIGMPHRGRLALLAAQMDYPIRRMLHKVAGRSEFPQGLEGVVDDVTSHLAASLPKHYTHSTPSPDALAPLRVSLLHNPSHLEIVGCVAAGKTRAKRTGGEAGALCLQIHGDAAMSGQGCIQETLSLARLRGFDVGGTVHLVVNNQLGFTTAQGEGGGEGRSSRYCTDVAKMLQVPIVHVNGEAVDDVILACKLAVEYRHFFGKDAFVDLHVYRLHGHNEVDEPAFTNPLTYARVRDPGRQTVTPAGAYIEKLVGEGLMTGARAERLRQQFDAHLEKEYEASLSYDIQSEEPDAFKGKWSKMRHPKGEELHHPVATGVPLDVLHHIGAASVALPTTHDFPTPFSLHPRLAKSFVQARQAALEKGSVDWATAEALAIGSLLAQGFDVRLCGQDVGRGTFSQRHFLLTDQETGATYCALAHVVGSTGRLEVVNSNLSELAVLGFEYGHSLEEPMRLGIWEAQFGDFANGAQIVVDTFLSGGESKWLRQSGLVLLLPHGQDGAGPEHSSARLERFLQLSNDVPPPQPSPGPLDSTAAASSFPNVNLLVQHPTTPANYFHALRRQMLRPCRKPLVVMAPKTLLRHPLAVSPLEAMAVGESFQPVLASTLDGRAWPIPAAGNGTGSGSGNGAKRRGPGRKGKKDGARKGEGRIKAVVFCSGKVYYDAIKAPPEGVDPASVLLVRLEELSPFPRPAVERLLDGVLGHGGGEAPKALLWLQEEPLNAGAWAFVQPHLTRLLQGRAAGAASSPILPPLEYVGRPALPTPAVGLGEAHKRQSAELMAALWARLAEAAGR